MRVTRVGAVALCVCALSVGGASSLAASLSPAQRIARAGVLTIGDFSAGWGSQVESSSGTPSLSKVYSTLPICKPFLALLATRSTAVRASSADFINGGLDVSNRVAVYSDRATASRPFAAAKTVQFSGCIQQAYERGIRLELIKSGQASAAPGLAVSVEPANPGIAAGDDQFAVGATVGVTLGGVQQHFGFEMIAIRVGRVGDTFSYADETGPITDVEPNAVHASVSRIRAALGSRVH
jgi:hypothetical protein